MAGRYLNGKRLSWPLTIIDMAKKRESHWIRPLWPAIFALTIIFVLGIFTATEKKPSEIGPEGSAHMHADFKVYIDGKEIDFSRKEYNEKSSSIHLHLDNPYGPYVLHIEASNASIGMFFRSIGMELNKNCLVAGTQRSYCNSGGKRLRMFVNGEENFDFGGYAPKDLDRILMTWGSSNHDIAVQMTTVTDYACIFSRMCPGRGAGIMRDGILF